MSHDRVIVDLVRCTIILMDINIKFIITNELIKNLALNR